MRETTAQVEIELLHCDAVVVVAFLQALTIPNDSVMLFLLPRTDIYNCGLIGA